MIVEEVDENEEKVPDTPAQIADDIIDNRAPIIGKFLVQLLSLPLHIWIKYSLMCVSYDCHIWEKSCALSLKEKNEKHVHY